MELSAKLRELLTFLHYEVKSRSHNKVQGIVWMLAFPILTFCAHLFFAASVSTHTQNEIDILSILCCSVAWYYFSQTIIMTINIYIYRSEFIKTTTFDKNIFSKAIMMMNFIIGMIAFLIIFTGLSFYDSKYLENFNFIYFLIAQANLLIFTYAMVLLLSNINAIYRDIVHIANFVLQLIFFTSPILYRKEIQNEFFRSIQTLNPFLYQFKLFHYGAGVDFSVDGFETLIACSFLTVLTLFLGKYINHRNKAKLYFYV